MWSSAQYHKHESSRFACNCAVYYKSSLQSQLVVLIQYEEYIYMRVVHLCVTATGAGTQWSLYI